MGLLAVALSCELSEGCGHPSGFLAPVMPALTSEYRCNNLACFTMLCAVCRRRHGVCPLFASWHLFSTLLGIERQNTRRNSNTLGPVCTATRAATCR
jgi:hypothetical protein